MRLVCPDCGAQYEIDGALIPRAGRDVQCSACGHAWFHHHPDAPPQKPDADAETPLADESPSPNATRHPDDTEGTPGAVPSRKIDPGVLEVLREEADFEARARARESGTLETQPELGLVPTRPQAPSPSARKPRPEGAKPADAGASEPIKDSAPSHGASGTDRGGRLPDIESISSALSQGSQREATQDKAASAPVGDNTTKSGFLRGFVFVLGVMILALAVYIGTPALSEAIPALADPLAAYVAAVDHAHLWTTTQVEAITGWLITQLRGTG